MWSSARIGTRVVGTWITWEFSLIFRCDYHQSQQNERKPSKTLKKNLSRFKFDDRIRKSTGSRRKPTKVEKSRREVSRVDESRLKPTRFDESRREQTKVDRESTRVAETARESTRVTEERMWGFLAKQQRELSAHELLFSFQPGLTEESIYLRAQWYRVQVKVVTP